MKILLTWIVIVAALLGLSEIYARVTILKIEGEHLMMFFWILVISAIVTIITTLITNSQDDKS